MYFLHFFMYVFSVSSPGIVLYVFCLFTKYCFYLVFVLFFVCFYLVLCLFLPCFFVCFYLVFCLFLSCFCVIFLSFIAPAESRLPSFLRLPLFVFCAVWQPVSFFSPSPPFRLLRRLRAGFFLFSVSPFSFIAPSDSRLLSFLRLFAAKSALLPRSSPVLAAVMLR